MVSLERPAQRATCVIEPLESRQLLASTVYSSASVPIDRAYHVDGEHPGYISSAIVLKDGRLMIDSSTVDPKDESKWISRIMVFNPDGSASKTFSKSGILDIDTQGFNIPYVLQELSDGSVLHLLDLTDSDVIQRILPSGQLDRRFGTYGKLVLPNVAHLGFSDSQRGFYQVASDRMYFYSVDYANKTFKVLSYTLAGKWIKTQTIQLQNDLADVQSLEDGAVYLFSSDQKTDQQYITRYLMDGTPDQTFGNSGTINVTATFNRWAKKQRWETASPDYSSDGDVIKQPIGFTPSIGYSYFAKLSLGYDHGKLALSIIATGMTDSINTYAYLSDTHESRLPRAKVCLIIDGKGKLFAAQSDYARWKSSVIPFKGSTDVENPQDFFAGAFEIANAYGLFYESQVDDGHVDQFIPDKKGGFYIIGVKNIRLTIVHTLPFSGTISGRAFADKNADGIRQTGEKLLVNQQIYVDENGNGKYDSEELTTYTDTKGHYQFTGLYKGSYEVRVVPAKNQHVTTPIFSTGVITLKLGQSKWGEIGISV